MNMLRKAVDLLTEAALRLSAYGISVGYHNTDTEFYDFDGGIFWELFVGMLPTSIFIQLDTGNAATAKADVMECLSRATRRLTTVHAKAFSRKQPEALIGEDELPWDKIIRFCMTKGRTEWFILEYEKALYPPLTGTEKSFSNFQKILESCISG
jgi:sugar phosphate isomerase/epimerase